MNKVPKEILLIILPWMLLLTSCRPLSEPRDETGPTMPNETSPTTPTEGTQIGELAPDFQLQNLDGQVISLSDLRGKPVLINFWATWCPPCISEMPYMQEIYEEWSVKGLMLLAIDIGEGPSKVKGFLQTHNLSLPVLLDTERSVAEQYNITAIPTTLFIDKDGVIQEKMVGAFSSTVEIEKTCVRLFLS